MDADAEHHILTEGTYEELRDSAIGLFEPWQPRVGYYYAVSLGSGRHRVWSLLCVHSLKNDTVELDFLFEPFGVYRDMSLVDWFRMWHEGSTITTLADAIQRKLITDDTVKTLKANRERVLGVKFSSENPARPVALRAGVWEFK